MIVLYLWAIRDKIHHGKDIPVCAVIKDMDQLKIGSNKVALHIRFDRGWRHASQYEIREKKDMFKVVIIIS